MKYFHKLSITSKEFSMNTKFGHLFTTITKIAITIAPIRRLPRHIPIVLLLNKSTISFPDLHTGVEGVGVDGPHVRSDGDRPVPDVAPRPPPRTWGLPAAPTARPREPLASPHGERLPRLPQGEYYKFRNYSLRTPLHPFELLPTTHD